MFRHLDKVGCIADVNFELEENVYKRLDKKQIAELIEKGAVKISLPRLGEFHVILGIWEA